jgi:hypothetical protein
MITDSTIADAVASSNVDSYVVDVPSSSKSLEIQELAIAIAAKDHDPNLLNFDFLKFSGIIPDDWELARPAVKNERFSQVLFQNGVSITAEMNGKLVFAEPIALKDTADVKVADIACRYLSSLPRANYRAVGNNIRGHVLCNESEDAARQYFFRKLLSPEIWQQPATPVPDQAALQLVYPIEGGQMTLAINEARLQLPEQQPEQQPIPILLFSGNFNYVTRTDSQEQQIETFQAHIRGWQKDAMLFRQLIANTFL